MVTDRANNTTTLSSTLAKTKDSATQLSLPLATLARKLEAGPNAAVANEKTLALADKCIFIAATLAKRDTDEGTWSGEYRQFKEGPLEIEATFQCDGPIMLIVKDQGKAVLSYDDDNDDTRENQKRVNIYEPGKWENEVERLYMLAELAAEEAPSTCVLRKDI
jgi:hypothetical protein